MERRAVGGVGVSERREEEREARGGAAAAAGPEEAGQTAAYGRRATSLGLGSPSGTAAAGALHPGSRSGEREPRVPSAEIVKICKSCLKTNDSEAGFCLHCGHKLVTIAQEDDGRIGEVIGGKFTVVDFVDRGGMGEVYLGVNEPLGQRVAVKFLSRRFATDEHLVRRFLNEARSYCRVNHPNAVTLLDYGQHHDGSIYMVTEFVEGQNLTDTLRAQGRPLTQDQAVSAALQLCEVLSAAHHQGIIHRDLKPDNLMLIPGKRDRYSIKVLDFGIAKFSDEEDHALNTETGAVFGTPEFMSPEQARGDVADPRSDLYAVGLILFYMLTGKLPFRGKSKFAVLSAQVNERPPRPSEVAPAGVKLSPALEAIILKCLNKRSEERYQDADDLHEALKALRLGTGTDTYPSTPQAGILSSAPPSAAAAAGLVVESEALLEEPSGEVEALGDAFHFGLRPQTGPDLDPIHAAHADTLDGASLVAAIDLSHEHPDPPAARLLEEAGQRPVARRMVAGVLVVLAAVVAAAMAFGGRDVFQPVDDSTGPEAPPPVSLALGELERVMVIGQVVGLMAAAEDALRTGNLDAAGRLVQQTRIWMDDAVLPLAARDRRRALEQRLTRARAVGATIEEALAQNECDHAAAPFVELKDFSPGLARDLAPRINACAPLPPAPKESSTPTTAEPPAPAPIIREAHEATAPPAAGETASEILQQFNEEHGDEGGSAGAQDGAPQKQVEGPQKQVEGPQKQVEGPQKQVEGPQKQVPPEGSKQEKPDEAQEAGGEEFLPPKTL